MKKCFTTVFLVYMLFSSNTVLSESSPQNLYVSPSLQSIHSTLKVVTQKDPKDFSARWFTTFFYGKMSQNSFAESLIFQNKLRGHSGQADQYSFEIGYSLGHDNLLRKIFRPFVTNVELVANATLLDDPRGEIWQLNPYLMVRWRNFPWDRVLTTTFGIGDGISWGSGIPTKEGLDKDPRDLRKTLNLLVFEATFALPQYPHWQLFYRIHHRSGVFRLYTPSLIGSNVIGVGLRFWA